MSLDTTTERSFISEVFQIKDPDRQALTKVSCHWRIATLLADGESSRYYRSIDLLLSLTPLRTNTEFAEDDPCITDATGTTLDNLVRHVQKTFDETEVAVKVVLAPCNGYVCRSDILDLRMQHSEFVETVVSFSTWDQRVTTISACEQSNLLLILLSAPGAILAKRSPFSHLETLKLLQNDMKMRLSFDWILPTKPAICCVAVVAGRPMREPSRGIYWSQPFFNAAQALGISLIVFDQPGHWLGSAAYAHLVEQFIAIDLCDAERLSGRMVEALKGKIIHGIVTFTDDFVIATAEAAEMMGLPSEPAQAMRQAHFKHEMRKKLNNEAIHLESVEDLGDPTLLEKLKILGYPLIVKPSRGVYSRGVKKATNDWDMRQAVRALAQDGLAEHGILLERFIDGPELDANFALWDGQVLFLEVCDNFPCRGDAVNATLADSFSETVLISNSRLPPEEVEIIRHSLQSNLLQLGFRSGVFHVEARMQDSSMRYQDDRGDGILDLSVIDLDGCAANHSNRRPSVFLIEINARPPGAGGNWATLFTYGVDLGALQLLRAINDSTRFKALSKPYSFTSASPGDGAGAQWWTAHSMIPVHRENIRVPVDFFKKLYQALPDIVPHILRAELYAQPETVVSPSGGVGWVGYLLLFSRASRRHALDMYHRVSGAAEKILDHASGYDS